jgi:selenocysteine lyase/cysteine desulfurase
VCINGDLTRLHPTDLITSYLTNTNVQLGADYSVSATATQRVYGAAEDARVLFGAASKDEVVFGPSSTANLENLARGLEGSIEKGDEFVITGEHEGALFLLFVSYLWGRMS